MENKCELHENLTQNTNTSGLQQNSNGSIMCCCFTSCTRNEKCVYRFVAL